MLAMAYFMLPVLVTAILISTILAFLPKVIVFPGSESRTLVASPSGVGHGTA